MIRTKYKFGKSSLKELHSCHEDLQKILNLAISLSKIDFGISEGYRTIEKQNKLFMLGRSKIDGVIKKGKHNLKPSEAADLYVYHEDDETRRTLAYDKKHLTYLGGLIDACAEILYFNGEISHTIRWGANWDMDGVIDYDQDFDDFPHFELIKP